jgi:5-hydroxyisourate hydrolase
MFATDSELSLASSGMGQLTTHVLDISAGLPAAGVRIEVHGSGHAPPELLASTLTGDDGRCTAPLLSGSDFRAGRYVLTFYLAEYFRRRGVELPDPPFLEEAIVRIGISHPDQHYHVPLLVSPWSYSVYRGG